MYQDEVKREMALRERSQRWIKQKFQSLHLQRHSFKKPIFIFSTRRSGSTLLTEMIYSQKGLNYSGQPLDLWKYHPYREYLPQPYLYQFISLEPEEEQMLQDFFCQLLDGQIKINSQWNIFNPSYSFIVDRLVVKLLNTKPLIDWFTQRFDIEPVYLLRHPIPSALSTIRRRWGCVAGAFLKDDSFCRTYLDENQVNECCRILERGSDLQKHVLEWGLDNLVPLSIYDQRPWLTLTYEELIARPGPVCRLLADRHDLPDPERMHQRIARPSRTALSHSKTDITEKGSQYLLRRWLDEVDPETARGAMSILQDLLDIRVYRHDSPYPAPELCHFGPFEPEGNPI